MILTFNFLSRTLSMQTNVTVCIPSYSFDDRMAGRKSDIRPGEKFQVIYLLHGGAGDNADYLTFSNIALLADRHKLAVVMPNGYNSWYENLQDDPRGLGGGKYWDYVSDELPRVCEALLPISDRRENRFVGGLSMGAYGAMRFAILQPERFSVALMLSSTYFDRSAMGSFVSDDGETDAGALQRKAEGVVRPDLDLYRKAKANAEQGKPLPKLTFACGGDDFMAPAVRTSRALMQSLGYSADYHEYPGYAHEWRFWDFALTKAFEDWLPLRGEPIPQ